MPIASPYSFRRFLEPDVFPRGPVEDEEELEMLNRLRMIAEGYGPKPDMPSTVSFPPVEVGPEPWEPLRAPSSYWPGIPSEPGLSEVEARARSVYERSPALHPKPLDLDLGALIRKILTPTVTPPGYEQPIRMAPSPELDLPFGYQSIEELNEAGTRMQETQGGLLGALGALPPYIGPAIAVQAARTPLQSALRIGLEMAGQPIREAPIAAVRTGAKASQSVLESVPPQVRRFLEEETGAAKIPKEPDLPLPRTPEEVANLPDASLPRLIQQLRLGSQADVLEEIASLRGNASQKAAEGDVEAARYLRREAALKRDSVNSAIIERIEQGVPAHPTGAEREAALRTTRQTAEPKPAEELLRKRAAATEPTISFPKEPAPAAPPVEPTILPSVMPEGLDEASRKKYIIDDILQRAKNSVQLERDIERTKYLVADRQAMALVQAELDDAVQKGAPRTEQRELLRTLEKTEQEAEKRSRSLLDPLVTPREQFAMINAALRKPQSDQAAWTAYRNALGLHNRLVKEAIVGKPIDSLETPSTKEMTERVKEVYRQRERVLPEILAEHPNQSLARIIANKEAPYGWDKRIKWGKAEDVPESAKLPQPVPETPAIAPARGMGEDVLIKGPAVEAPFRARDFEKLHGGKKVWVSGPDNKGIYRATMPGSKEVGEGNMAGGAITDLHDKLSGRAGRVSEKLPPAPKIEPLVETPPVAPEAARGAVPPIRETLTVKRDRLWKELSDSLLPGEENRFTHKKWLNTEKSYPLREQIADLEKWVAERRDVARGGEPPVTPPSAVPPITTEAEAAEAARGALGAKKLTQQELQDALLSESSVGVPPPPGGGLPEVPEGPVYEQPAAAKVPETSPKRSAARANRARKQQQRARDIIDPENNVVKTESPEAGGGKIPPGGARRPPTPPSPDGEPLTYPDDFTRLREAMRVRDVDQELFDVSLQNGMKIEDPAKPFITPWSRALWSIITPSTSYDRRLRLPIFSSENYMKSQGTHTGMRRSAMFEIVREAFGTVTDKKIGWLERLYRGPEPTSDVLKDKVGTLWHALDQSEHYDLSPIQKEAVQAWQEMLDAEMKFSRRNGVSSGMVEGIWVGRMVKAASGVRLSDESLSTAGLSLYQRGMFKKRRLDLEGFAKAVDHYNTAHPDAKLDIDTDLAKILSRRLMSTANARGEQIFIRSAAHNAGGRLLTGKHTTHQGESLVIVRSGNQTQRWAFPANVANQVQQIVGGTTELPTEKAIKSVMENVAGSILNVDASVMGLRQAFLAIKADPVDALRGYGEAVQGWLNPHYRAIWLANNWEGMARAQLDGLELTITPTDIAKPLEYSPKRIFVDRLPIVGQINEFSFDVLMPILKYKRHQANLATLHAMRDGVKGGVLKANFVENIIRNVPGLQGASRKVGKSIQDLSDQELRRVAADAANNYLGGVDWTKIGQRGAARQVLSRFMLLTEGWMRAQVNMLKNASTLTAEGAMARRLLLQDISATALLSSAMSFALTGELPEFDPRDSHWLDVKTPWGYFTISPNKVLLRTVARVIAGPPPTATGRIDDPFSERYRALWQWFDGKQGPGVRQIVEQVGGKTFTGEVIPDDPISRAVNVLRAYSPILVQQVAKEQVDYRSDPQSAAARIAGEALGAGTQPYSAYQRATQDLSRSTPKELFTYNNAPTIVGREIARGNTELADTIKTYLQTKVKAARERTEKEKDLVQKFEQTEPRLAAAARSEVDRLRDLLAAQDPDLLSHLRSQREIRLDFDPERFMVSRSKFTPLPRSSKGKLLMSWGKDATKDYWADVMGKRWGVDAGSDKKVAYMELPIAGRLEVDEFIARLDEMTVKKYNAQGKTEWRTLPSKAKTAIQNAVKKPSKELFEPEPLKR